MRRETQNLLLVLLGGALLKIAFTGVYLRYVKPSLLPWLVLAGVVMVALAGTAIWRDIRAGAAESAPPRRQSSGESTPQVCTRAADGSAGSGAVVHADAAGRSEESAESPSGHAAAFAAGARAEGTVGVEPAGGSVGDRAAVAAEPGHVSAGHEHRSRSPWMLLLPVLAIFLVGPPALGSDSIGRAGQPAAVPQRPSGTGSLFGPLPPGEAPLLTVSEFQTRVVWDTSGSLDDRAVRLQGFVVHPDDDPGRTRLARMRISCCAADAAPVLVDLSGPAAAALANTPADTWIEVTGALRTGSATEANGQVPTVDITAVHGIPTPPNPYEY